MSGEESGYVPPPVTIDMKKPLLNSDEPQSSAPTPQPIITNVTAAAMQSSGFGGAASAPSPSASASAPPSASNPYHSGFVGLVRTHSARIAERITSNETGLTTDELTGHYSPRNRPMKAYQIAVIFIVAPILETLFWISLPLDYNVDSSSADDTENTPPRVNFGVLIVFILVYVVCGATVGTLVPAILTRTVRIRFIAMIVGVIGSVVVLINALMYAGKAPNSAFTIASIYVVPPAMTAITLIIPFFRVYQLHTTAEDQTRHRNTAIATLLNGMVGTVLWIGLNALSALFVASGGKPSSSSIASSSVVVILFTVSFQTAIALQSVINHHYCSAAVCWQLTGIFRFIYSVQYFQYYRILFLQVQRYDEFFLYQSLHLITDIIPFMAQFSQTFVSNFNRLLEGCRGCCGGSQTVFGGWFHGAIIKDIRLHRASLAQSWVISLICRLFSLISLSICGSYLRSIDNERYYPSVHNGSNGEYQSWIAFIGLMAVTELFSTSLSWYVAKSLYRTASAVVTAVAAGQASSDVTSKESAPNPATAVRRNSDSNGVVDDANAEFNLLDIPTHLKIGTEYYWALLFGTIHFANDPFWSIINYRVF